MVVVTAATLNIDVAKNVRSKRGIEREWSSQSTIIFLRVTSSKAYKIMMPMMTCTFTIFTMYGVPLKSNLQKSAKLAPGCLPELRCAKIR